MLISFYIRKNLGTWWEFQLTQQIFIEHQIESGDILGPVKLPLPQDFVSYIPNRAN